MFLPISKDDMINRGWDELDFVYITGEAIMDHPSLGQSVICRLLEKEGFKVGMISQPKKDADYRKLGTPKIAFLISSGTIDSMVNNYTVNKRKRNDDAYSPGNKGGNRPDRATIVYSNKVKQLFPESYVIIGGIEASLRRFAHYDYWSDSVMQSIIFDSKADLLMYGMGEVPYWEISALIKKNVPIQKIKNVRGTCYIATSEEIEKLKSKEDVIILPSFEECKESKTKYAKAFKVQYENQDSINGKILVQKHGKVYFVQNKVQRPLKQSELDKVYAYSYERTYHPSYEKQGGVKALEEVQFSLTSQRGCFGGCNFCAITFHQGRTIQSRSKKSIMIEAEKITHMDNFKGYIHDVGGPTANFRRTSCDRQLEYGVCQKRQCLFPNMCKNVVIDHSEYLDILRSLRQIPGVKKVFVRSGIRYDYLIADKDETFFKELCQNHISGQLKVAPEHVSNNVLKYMGKPNFEVYKKFTSKYEDLNSKLGMNQYLVPYLMSSHPGSTLKDAVILAEYLRDIGHMPEQVQDYYPTPGTVSTCMFYTGLNPLTMEKVYIPKSDEEKRMQRALIQYRKKENYELVYKALIKAGREDLIGFDKKCLIKPKREEAQKFSKYNTQYNTQSNLKTKNFKTENRNKKSSERYATKNKEDKNATNNKYKENSDRYERNSKNVGSSVNNGSRVNKCYKTNSEKRKKR